VCLCGYEHVCGAFHVAFSSCFGHVTQIWNVFQVLARALSDCDFLTCAQDARHKVNLLQYTLKSIKQSKSVATVEAAVRMVGLLEDADMLVKQGLASHCEEGEEHVESSLESGREVVEKWVAETEGKSKEAPQDAVICKYIKVMRLHRQPAPVVHDNKSKHMPGPPQFLEAVREDAAHARDLSLLLSEALHLSVPAGFDVGECWPSTHQPRSACLYLSLARVDEMAKERQVLCDLVLPAVQARCAALGVNFTWVDGAGGSQEACPTDNPMVRCSSLVASSTIAGKGFLFVLAPSSALVQADTDRGEALAATGGQPHSQSKPQPLSPVQSHSQSPLQLPLKPRTSGSSRPDGFKQTLKRVFKDIFDAWSYFDINGDWNVSTVEFVRMAAALGINEVK
jgi:hypothetical protein